MIEPGSTLSLDLDPEWGGEDLLDELERSFSVSFSTEETTSILNVGDIFNLLRKKIALGDGSRCRSQMAFYRLRHVLAILAPDADLRPSTRLDSLDAGAPKKYFRALERASALRLPDLSMTWLGFAGTFVGFVASVGLLVFAFNGAGLISFFGSVAAFLCMMMVASMERGKLPRGVETLGDLARAAGGKNFAQLSALGAKTNEREIWSALVEVLAEHSNGLSRGQISASTVLFNSCLKEQPVSR